MSEHEIDSFFAQYEWEGEEVEPGIWRATFTTEDEVEFDLFVMLGEEWVHFAVTPLARVDAPEMACRLMGSLLRLNQQTRLVRLALDDERDVNLVADMPRNGFDYSHFALVVDLLVKYTETLAREIQRTLDDERYYSPLLPSV